MWTTKIIQHAYFILFPLESTLLSFCRSRINSNDILLLPLHAKNMSFIFTVVLFSVHLFSSSPLPVSISLICHVELDRRSTQGLVRLEKDRRSAGHSLHETPRPRPTKVIVTEVEVSMNFENEKSPHLFSTSWFNFIHSIVNWSWHFIPKGKCVCIYQFTVVNTLLDWTSADKTWLGI